MIYATVEIVVFAALLEFRAAYPDVHIQMETGYAADALSMLKQGTDATVAALPAKLPPSITALDGPPAGPRRSSPATRFAPDFSA